MQTVSCEDDLYEPSLAVPQRNRAGATVTLSAPVGKVRVWTNADKSGTMLIGENQSSKTWTYDDKPPASVFVEAIAASVSMSDIAFTLVASETAATQPVTRPTTQQKTATETNIGLDLHFRGQNLGRAGNGGSVVVGERVKVQAIPLGPIAFATHDWEVDDPSIERWDTATAESGGFASEVILLTRLDQSDVSFHWVDGGVKEVDVTAVWNGREFSGRARFDVARPSLVVDPDSRGNPAVSDLYRPTEPEYALHNGDGNHNDRPTAGFWAEATLPQGFEGQLCWVQTISGFRRRLMNADSAWHRWDYAGLDGQFPLRSGNTVGDSPGTLLDRTRWQEVHLDETFQTWCMFKPPNSPDGPSEWVPLVRIDWGWRGKALWTEAMEMWLPVPNSMHEDPVLPYSTFEYPQWYNIISTASPNYQPE